MPENVHFADPKLFFRITFLCFSSRALWEPSCRRWESESPGLCVTDLWNSEKEWPGAEAAQIIWVLALRRCWGGMCFTWLKVLIWHKWQPLASDVDIRPLETMFAFAWASWAKPQPDSFSNCLLLTCHRGIHFSPSQFTQLRYCSCCGLNGCNSQRFM